MECQNNTTEEQCNTIDLMSQWLSNFDANIVKNSVLKENISYLEKTIVNLETLCLKSKEESQKASTSRARARARDTEKTIEGLINGIKFSISFMHYGNKEDLNVDIVS